MKSGKYSGTIIIGLICGFIIERRKANVKSLPVNLPSISQYINRFSEFYTDELIKEVEKEFISLIDMGIGPEAAFDMLTIGVSN